MLLCYLPFAALNGLTGYRVKEGLCFVVTGVGVFFHRLPCSLMAGIILLVPIFCDLCLSQLVPQLLKLLIGLFKVVVLLKQLAVLELPLTVALVEALAPAPLPRGSPGAPAPTHAPTTPLVLLVLVVLVVVVVLAVVLLPLLHGGLVVLLLLTLLRPHVLVMLLGLLLLLLLGLGWVAPTDLHRLAPITLDSVVEW